MSLAFVLCADEINWMCAYILSVSMDHENSQKKIQFATPVWILIRRCGYASSEVVRTDPKRWKNQQTRSFFMQTFSSLCCADYYTIAGDAYKQIYTVTFHSSPCHSCMLLVTKLAGLLNAGTDRVISDQQHTRQAVSTTCSHKEADKQT